ncbi:MAG: solute carrier family 23 protein, partial [Lutispora sp.]|nr:solute carrier family 23 protein [Lutispora sp.]
VVYIAAVAMGMVDFTPLAQAAWLGLPPFILPKFGGAAISIVAPVAIASMVEHIGDVLAVSATVGEDFVSDPGLHRTLLGDGVATSLAAMIGGPANTTYSENTGVLALTKVFDPWVMRIAACFAIVLSMIPKLGAVISTIPGPVIGGISIVLFGMIASIGIRTVVENKVDFSLNRNLIIGAVILVFGIGGAVFDFKIFQLAGMALGAIVGIILNKVLPEDK